jgi:hypothetical protein
MTKLETHYWQAPERREGRATQGFRFMWSMLCWLTAFMAVVCVTTVFMR